MTLSEFYLLLSATAQWCGQPGLNIDDKYIFQCREYLMVCATKADSDKKMKWQKKSQVISDCFRTILIKRKEEK